MAHGFTVKEGQTDLKQYVYDAAYALLAMGSAPQPVAQEPVALLVRKNSWRAGQWEVAPPGSPSYGLGWADQRKYVCEAPQPAPLSDDVVKDAARYRWLIDQHWIQTEVDWRLIPTHQDSTIRQLGAAIDAAIAAQGGKA